MSIYGFPGMQAEYLGTMAAPYVAIQKPQYTLSFDTPTGRASLHGPIDHHAGKSIQHQLTELFGADGLSIELKPKQSPEGVQHFVAHFTGAAYGRLQTAKQAFENTQQVQRNA